MSFTLEVIGFNIESCIIAQFAGAHRIELCDNAGEGGTTPSYGFIKSARQVLKISLYPIIRPRGGDFFYSDSEFDIMKTDIKLCRALGCEGVVTGILNTDGTVDKKRCKQLTDLAYPMAVSFHRAFDRTNDPFRAMEDIIEAGFERILTSGQQPVALEGVALIAQLIAAADGRVSIMPGSGVRSNNIISLAEQTGATEFHTSARTYEPTRMSYINEQMKERLDVVSADGVEIKKIVQLLKDNNGPVNI